MAANREKRVNAGNRLAKLLRKEQEDFYLNARRGFEEDDSKLQTEAQGDFYLNAYGGFEDGENDEDYKPGKEEEDIVDSDFSFDEESEIISDHEEEEKNKKKYNAYRDPKKTKESKKIASNLEKNVTSSNSRQQKRDVFDIMSYIPPERKSSRSTSILNSEALFKKLTNPKKKRKTAAKKKQHDQWPTQEELLEEAKLTEQKNLREMETYQKMILEREEKIIPTKSKETTCSGAKIIYCSTTVPLLTDSENVGVEAESKTKYLEENGDNETPVTKGGTKDDYFKKCEKSFLTFTDLDSYRAAFPQKKPPTPKEKQYCPITGKPAKYLDPMTGIPYADSKAFKLIREAYYRQIEQKISNGTVEDLDPEEVVVIEGRDE